MRANDPATAFLPPELRDTLGDVARIMRATKEDWWIIGSAAVALHGGAPITVADVDVLTSETAAHAVTLSLALTPMPGKSDALFRSRLFTRWTATPLRIEVMGSLTVRDADGWHNVDLSTRAPIAIDDQVVYVPNRAELRALLLRFGRPKDLARAALLA